MSDLAITFHFTETKATISRSTFHRLSVQQLKRTTGTTVKMSVDRITTRLLPVNFIIDHMLETLVVGRAEENLRVHLAASEAAINDLVTSLLVAIVVQDVRDL